MTDLDKFFARFRQGIIGESLPIMTPNGQLPMIYADWTASGRLYLPIEQFMQREIAPLVANTHTETSLTGKAMTQAYHEAREIIKQHVGACSDDICLFVGSGMTGAINKLIRILGISRERTGETHERPVVFITHMEHHSNQLPWIEHDVDVEIVQRGTDSRPDVAHLQQLLVQYQGRRKKIGAFSACSNVTGIKSDYYRLAELMHEHGGICVVDFACSAPYADIDMHPGNPMQALDAIVFSPHKFLGGPGSSGVLVLSRGLHQKTIPDEPGGGTVAWTDPWGGRRYLADVELREDSGTPPFLQVIRAALAVRLKQSMTVEKIAVREAQLVAAMYEQLATVPGLVLLEGQQRERLPVFSFYIPGIHHNLVCSLLNDYYAIQARGGCSCAGTLGHLLLGVGPQESAKITEQIDGGDLSCKPGWIRMSLHPTSTKDEIARIGKALRQIVANAHLWENDYRFDASCGEFTAKHPLDQGISIPQLTAACL